jgi:hypothetical protein
MEEERSSAQKIYEQVEQYAKTSLELYRLKAIDTSADIFAVISTGLIIWVFFSFFLVFVSIGAAFYFGELLGKWYYGFFIVAGIYMVIGLIVYAIRKKYLKEKINNYVIRQIFKE